MVFFFFFFLTVLGIHRKKESEKRREYAGEYNSGPYEESFYVSEDIWVGKNWAFFLFCWNWERIARDFDATEPCDLTGFFHYIQIVSWS